MNKHSSVAFSLLAASLVGLSGCATEAAGDPETVGDAAEAFTESTCDDYVDSAFYALGGAQVSSPASYNPSGCYKSYRVQATWLNVLDPTNPEAGIFVVWTADAPTTESACESATLASKRYTWNGSAWVYNETRSIHGVWASWNDCLVPALHYPTANGMVSNGGSYLFVTTAVTSWGRGAEPLGSTREFTVAAVNEF